MIRRIRGELGAVTPETVELHVNGLWYEVVLPPASAEHLAELAQADIDERWHYYEQLAGIERSLSADPEEELGHPQAEQPETD